MGEFNVVFGVCALMLAVSSVLSQAMLSPAPTPCTLKSFLHCSEVLNSLENDTALTDGSTCGTLDGAISCVQGVMDACDYPCNTPHKDYGTTNDGKCPMYTQLYISPVFSNLDSDEHPCVVLQVLKHCRDTKCNTPPTDTFGRNLHALGFEESTKKDIQGSSGCTQNPITKYIKRFEDETIEGLTYDTCQEMELSWKFFEQDLDGTFECSASRIQEMSVDMAGNGMKPLIEACRNVSAPVVTAAPGVDDDKECDASTFSNPLAAMFVVVMGYLFLF